MASDLEKPGGEGSWRYLEEPSKDAKSSVFDGMVVEVNESGPGSDSDFLLRPRACTNTFAIIRPGCVKVSNQVFTIT